MEEQQEAPRGAAANAHIELAEPIYQKPRRPRATSQRSEDERAVPDATAARPKRRPDPDASRLRILSAASAAFAAQGYAGARTEEIARRAGMSQRMLYHYFGSKEELYASVAYESYRQLFDRLRRVQDATRSAPVLTRLREFMLAYFEVMHTDERIVRLMQWESAQGWQMFHHLCEAGHVGADDVNNTLVADFDEGKRIGVIRSDIDSGFALTISGTLGTYYTAFLPRAQRLLADLPYGARSTPEARQALVDFFLRGITVA